ncbi:MAG: SDR family oxidoreductase [Sporolactobacillus sp.]
MWSGKLIVITGASSGVGYAAAHLFAERGSRVILLARNASRLADLEREIRRKRQQAASFVLDVTDGAAVSRIFSQIMREFGIPDLLINCAGIGIFQSFDEMDRQVMDKMVAVNFVGLMACTRAVLPAMLARGRGHLVNIASIAGKLATPKAAVYAATKHAVMGFSDGLRLEIADQGVRVTVINPGPIRTPFMKRADPEGDYAKHAGRYMLSAEKVAAAIVRAVEKNKREVNMPWYMGLGAWLHQLAPRLFERIAGNLLKMK